MIYIMNIFISLLIGYFFHICLHYIPFLRNKHESGHHVVYAKKFKTKKFLFNNKNDFNVLNFSFRVEYFIFIYFFIYWSILYYFDINLLFIIPVTILLLWMVDYVHRAFHIIDHPLMKFKIFRDACDRHVHHHTKDHIWYGLGLGDWADVIFRTSR